MDENHSNHNKLAKFDHQNQVSAALLGIGKLFKAVRFYPPGHPALESTCKEAHNLLSPLLRQGNLILSIKKNGFYWQGKPVSSEIPVLKALAFYFFARLVHRLLFLPDLTTRDLEAFARCAIGEPAEIQRAGGLQELLLQQHITGLFLNEIDLQTIQARREEILIEQGLDPELLDQNPFEPPPEASSSADTDPSLLPEALLENLTTAQLDPEELLRQLEGESSDQRYRLLCQKLVVILPEHLHELEWITPGKALLLLARHGAEKARNNTQRRACLEALDQLGSPELMQFFINALCDKHQHSAGRTDIIKALSMLQEKAAVVLVDRLAKEDNSQVRKLLSEALVKLGNCATPALVERLADNRWYIARNAIAILGKIKNRKTAIHIRPYLDHRDYRVRREAVRALSLIGGPIALKGLQKLINDRDRELCPLAIVALGAMQNEAAVDPLLRLLGSFDPLLKNFDLKKRAIKALGAIGAPQAAPALIKVLNQKRFWKRNLYNKLRSCAIQALGNIATENSLAALEVASKDSSPLIAHIAREALDKISARTQNEF
ncbi:MAG: HEAT repeat domain-containing protein [Desulfuromonadaceae bacterium]|nr:HEAT repeat domain-containing protein [Desulfuromonadaceae bacterium]